LGIYLAAPYQQIGFVCDVTQTNLSLDDVRDNIQPFISNKGGGPKKHSKPFMQLKKIATIEIDKASPLALQCLKQHGLTGMLMGPRKLENNPALLDYIKRNLS